MDEKLPSVYEYNDFRKFLDEYQKERHKTDKTFNRSSICKLLGLPNTRSYFTDVLNGKPLSPEFVNRFVRAFELNADEAKYFKTLVKYNQSQEPEERELLFEQLISLNKTPSVVIDSKAFEFYREWYHSVIRVVLDIVDFTDDYRYLASLINPPILARQAQQSISLLLRLGLIAPNAQGNLKPTQKVLVTSPYMRNGMIQQYQSQCLSLSRRALFSDDPLLNVSTNTLSVSEDGCRRIERQLQQFKKRIRSIVHKDEKPADRVYQLNIQMFKLAQKK